MKQRTHRIQFRDQNNNIKTRDIYKYEYLTLQLDWKETNPLNPPMGQAQYEQ